MVIGNDAVINSDVTSGGNVQVGDRTRVQGDVTAGGTITMNAGGGAVITGLQTQHAAVSSMTIPTKTVTPGSTNVTVNSGQGTAASPFVIAPGSYGTITVNSNNVITMSGGVYQVGQLIINADVTLNLNQTASSAIDFRVQTNLSFGDRFIVNLATTPAGVVAQFYSAQSTGEVHVGTNIASFPLAVTAPNGTIHVFSGTNVSGQLAGKTVTLEPDVGVGRVPVDDWLGSGSSGVEFLGYPTGVSYTVDYAGGFFGSTGPLAFGLVSWKALLASAMLQLDLAVPGAVTADLAATANAAVVGTVKAAVLNAPTTAPTPPPTSTQAGSVDAAVVTVRGNRALGAPLFTYLDASTGEANSTPISALGGVFGTVGFMANSDIDAALAAGGANLKVHKSGAGTGVTHGIISALLPVVARDDESGTLQFVNQILIVPDPAFPAAGGLVADLGDSGSLWVQTSSNKLVGMTHTVGSSGAVASRIQDVVNALGIQLTVRADHERSARDDRGRTGNSCRPQAHAFHAQDAFGTGAGSRLTQTFEASAMARSCAAESPRSAGAWSSWWARSWRHRRRSRAAAGPFPPPSRDSPPTSSRLGSWQPPPPIERRRLAAAVRSWRRRSAEGPPRWRWDRHSRGRRGTARWAGCVSTRSPTRRCCFRTPTSGARPPTPRSSSRSWRRPSSEPPPLRPP